MVDVLKGLSTSYPSYLKFVRSANRLLPYYEKLALLSVFKLAGILLIRLGGKKKGGDQSTADSEKMETRIRSFRKLIGQEWVLEVTLKFSCVFSPTVAYSIEGL